MPANSSLKISDGVETNHHFHRSISRLRILSTPTAVMSRLTQHLSAWLLAAVAALYYVPLGARALWDSDEGRYAEIAREMIQLHDWISPHLNYVLYFEKPPLMYWLTAIAELVFGPTAFAARFWCAFFAVATVAVTWAIGRTVSRERAGLLAGVFLATSILFFGLSQFLVLDMALTFWMTLELWALVRFFKCDAAPDGRARTVWILALGLAGGVLTKGLEALVLPGLVAAVTFLLTRPRVTGGRWPWVLPAIFVVVVTAPWFIAVSHQHPFFPAFFFIHEHVDRFFTTVHHRQQPFYFFIPVLLLGFLPWSLFLPRVLWSSWGARKTIFVDEAVTALLWVWTVLIVTFFSLSHSKLVGYVLPVFPALALLVAKDVDSVFDESPPPNWIHNGLVGMIALLIAGVVYLKMPISGLSDESIRDVLPETGMLVALLAFGVFVLVGVWGMRRTATCVGGMALIQVLVLSSVGSLAPRLDAYHSTRVLAQTFLERSAPQDPVVAYGVSFENRLQTFLFYTQRRLKVLGDPGELDMGLQHDPEREQWIVPEDRATAALHAEPIGTWGVTDQEHWKALMRESPDQFASIDRQGDLVLFQKLQ